MDGHGESELSGTTPFSGVDTRPPLCPVPVRKVMDPSDDRISFVPPVAVCTSRRGRYFARHETRGPRAMPGKARDVGPGVVSGWGRTMTGRLRVLFG